MALIANNLRKLVLKMVYDKQSGHIGGSFSIAELICYLYNNYDLIAGNDKLILSKGHAVPILYAVFYELGLLNDADLNKFREINSPLQGHPDKAKLSYIHATTGSLGQGLSIAIGHALAMRLKQTNNKVFCIMGDGELQEGQVWEGFMLAPKYKLQNLICFVDYNKAQNDGYVNDILPLEPLEDKIKAFGWYTSVINGQNYSEIEATINEIPDDNSLPVCIILDTIKGAGVSFMENPAWHAAVPSLTEYKKAMEELC